MLSLSPAATVNSTMGWPLEVVEPISHNNNNNSQNKNKNNNYFFTSSSEYYPFVPNNHQLLLSSSSSPTQSQVEVIERCTPSREQDDDPDMVKKMNHNASERDRRKRINGLYSSLRSLLPVADQAKKMSIPTTISRVLKYIPELQQQVETLTKKKEELLLRISRQGDAVSKEPNHQRKNSHHHNSAFVVSTSRLSESETSIQISTYEGHKSLLSEILLCLEKYGLSLLNASSFETFGGRVFYNLHFKVEKAQRLETEVLYEKLLSIYEMQQMIF